VPENPLTAPSVSYERFLAIRLLMRAHRQKFIPLVAWLSVTGVALGVGALIVVLSVMAGFEDDLQQKITAMSAHVWVQPFAGPPGAAAGALASTLKVKSVESAGLYMPKQALLQSRSSTTGAVIFGLDSAAARDVVKISGHVKNGKMADFSGSRAEIMLGSELAASLGAFAGDRITIITANSLTGTVPRILSVTVAGVFEVGMYEYDAHTAYIPLGAMKKLAGSLGDAGVMVRLRDMMNAAQDTIDIQAKVGTAFIARDWQTLNRNLFFAIRIERIVMFLIMLTIVTVAAFNITSSLIMTVMEKTRAIGVMNAMGMPVKRLGRIFVIQGSLVGAVGILAGVLAGLLVCLAISIYPLKMPGGGSVYYLTYLPVKINWLMSVVIIPAVSMGLCIVSALYPARQAVRLDPVEAIRYE
jgi:lipoprotein-releasing system permease protein